MNVSINQSMSSLLADGLDDFSQKLVALNQQNEIPDTDDAEDINDAGDTDDTEDMITDKTDDVRVIVSLDGTSGDADYGNR